MQEAGEDNFMKKTNLAITSAVRNARCNGGWLRVSVQALFCFITVASFILILRQSIQRSPISLRPDSENTPKCYVAQCRIICSQAFFDKQYEDDLTYTIKMAQKTCTSIRVRLNHPSFENESLPRNWMSNAKTSIDELSIVGGNLRNIRPNAFMSTFTKNLQILQIQDVNLSIWEPDMLVGLLHLRSLNIRNCRIDQIQNMALRSVDRTLENLDIRTCGAWDPSAITGSSNLKKLIKVDLSSNNFSDVLGSNSFTKLRNCKVLRLSSSRITAIQTGAFDFLYKIRMIYLNNNMLTTVSIGLFDIILSPFNPMSKVDLQNNLFHCNCNSDYITRLHMRGILLIEPLCYMPEDIRGMPVSVHQSFCGKNYKNKYIDSENDSMIIKMSGNCDVSVLESEMEYDRKTQTGYCRNISEILKPEIDFTKPTRIRSSAVIRLPLFEYSISVQKESGILYSKLDIDLWPTTNHGLIWYQTDCPQNIYCIETIPAHLIIYYIELDVSYTLCRVDASNFSTDIQECIVFDRLLDSLEVKYNFFSSKRRLYMFAISLIASSILGALVLYGIIHRNPSLMRSSKRVLIVKNGANDAGAIILPPKIPLRSFPMTPIDSKCAVPPRPVFLSANISRQESVRSYRSNAPSYISAIQPTEEQMKEWRLKQYFLSDLNVVSDTISNINDGDNVYNSLPPVSENIYERPITSTNLKIELVI